MSADDAKKSVDDSALLERSGAFVAGSHGLRAAPSTSRRPNAALGRREVLAAKTARRILVVDDEQASLVAMARLLGSQGYLVSTATDGLSALEAVRAEQADLVLMDVMMPGMDGIELCASIRQGPAGQLLPLIVMSGLSDRESRVRAKEAGADDYLVKPVDSLELMVRIESLLRMHQYHQYLEQHDQTLARELERATSQLLQLDRLSTAGSLAAGVGHELTHLSSVYKGALQRLTQALESGEAPDAELMRTLVRVGQQLGQHATRLLHMGEPGSTEPELVDLGALVTDALDLVRGSGRIGKIQLIQEMPAQGPELRLVRAEVEQVLINLVLNAAEALADVTVRAPHVCVRVEASDILGRARVHVIDNGHGIAEEHLDRVFEPYFTTKAQGAGAGLGLTLVRHLVEGCGGRVVIVSRPEQGTTVTVDFPDATQATNLPASTRRSSLRLES